MVIFVCIAVNSLAMAWDNWLALSVNVNIVMATLHIYLVSEPTLGAVKTILKYLKL